MVVARRALPVARRSASRTAWLQRVIDMLGAVVLLVVTLPVLVVGMVAVLVDSGRPIFFGHKRLGRRGRPFRCWKLRTMVVGAEARLDREPILRRRYVENGFKLQSHVDPRITRVGPWLRRTYIDELPQLFNVLGGTMSLVGPRPVVPDELTEYEPYADELLSVRPGLFGAWTSRGRKRPAYPERARLELQYVRNHTLAGDLSILIRSVPAVMSGQDER